MGQRFEAIVEGHEQASQNRHRLRHGLQQLRKLQGNPVIITVGQTSDCNRVALSIS